MSMEHLELNPWHKRQAALIQHFTSMEYLKSILPRVEKLIAMADAMLEERAHLDAAGVALANWSQTSTAIHFATHAYPALVELREGLIEDIALRAFDRFGPAGESQCSRMLDEYASRMIWATHEQERSFNKEAESVFRYAACLSGFVARPATNDDFIFWMLWEDDCIDRRRIPKFRVRTDVIARTDQSPPRTGIYVPKDDPYGAMQFAWTGGYGQLGNAYTLNEFGKSILQKIGRHGLWGDIGGLYRVLDQNRHLNGTGWRFITPETAYIAPSQISKEMFESRPCEWYFVEMIEGEYEDIDGTYAGKGSPSVQQGRVPGGKPVPQSGWWYSPGQGTRRYFKQNDIFPAITNSDWGDTFWLWALDQSTPTLG